jgi:hypothetical protein
MLDQSCLFARWITASASSAPERMLPRSSRSPRRTLAPLASRAAAEASDRARPVTSCPAASSSVTVAEPIQPEAPVTKTRMAGVPFGSAVSGAAVK